MKKKLLLCIAALSASAMLFGFDSAETAESIIDKANAASSATQGCVSDVKANADIALNISEGEDTTQLPITGNMEFNMLINMDPISYSMDGTMTYSALLAGDTMNIKSYAVTGEDNKMTLYSYVEQQASDGSEASGTWQYQTMDLPADLDALKSVSAAQMSEWGVNFTLDPAPVTVDGKECYQLTAVLDKAAFDTMIKKAEELSGQTLIPEEAKSVVDPIMAGIKINLAYCIDAATYLPVGAHIDLNGTDVSTLDQFIGMALGSMGEGTSLSLALNDLSMDMTMNYGPANDITIPQEALDAVASGAATNADDILASIQAGEIAGN